MATLTEKKRFLSVKEAASELCVHPMSIYRGIDSKTIPCVRVGGGKGAVRIPAAWIDAQAMAGV